MWCRIKSASNVALQREGPRGSRRGFRSLSHRENPAPRGQGHLTILTPPMSPAAAADWYLPPPMCGST